MAKPDHAMQTNDERIAWVIAHPGMSRWVKSALEGAIKCHPIDVQNDLEILNLLLRAYVAEGIHGTVADRDIVHDKAIIPR